MFFLISWTAYLNGQNISIKQEYKLDVWDMIQTWNNDSLAIITWWDGSVTRLWPNTQLEIEVNYVSRDKSLIQIAFQLYGWKTWSNVTSFFGEDSYFKEKFRDNEASVRGTIFNIDLENEYLYVTDHEIVVTRDSWEQIIVPERQPLSLWDFSFLQLFEFIKDIKDTAWEDLNKQIDREFLNNLRQGVKNQVSSLDIRDIEWLTETQKKELYNTILTKYQEVHFLSPWDDLYSYKLELQQKLLSVASDKNRSQILEVSLYDIKDAISEKSYENIESILQNFEAYGVENEILNKLEKHIDISQLPNELRQTIQDRLDFIISGWKVVEGITNQLQQDVNDAIDTSKSLWQWIKSLFIK